jgi:hypothetical protein
VPSNGSPRNELREFASIVQWDDIQYTRIDKKPKPPWAWFRLQLAFLRSPLWCSMTKTQRADFVSMCAAASQTGNLVPTDDTRWLRQFELTRKNVRTLAELGLIAFATLSPDDKRLNDLRSVLSVRCPPDGRHQNRIRAESDQTRTDASRSDALTQSRDSTVEKPDTKPETEVSQRHPAGDGVSDVDELSESRISELATLLNVWKVEREPYEDFRGRVLDAYEKHKSHRAQHRQM